MTIRDLFRHDEMRRAMGGAARLRAEKVLDVNVVAQARLDILRNAAKEARSHWHVDQDYRVRSLVDVNVVVSSLASSMELPRRIVTVGVADNVRFLPECSSPGFKLLCDALLDVAAATGPVPVADLVTAVAARFESDEDDIETDVGKSAAADTLTERWTRLCTRLITFGALRFH